MTVQNQTQNQTQTQTFNIQEIMNYLPHRYPMLLIDRVVEMIPNQSVHAYKNVTINEDIFNGHFPNHPIMPGVLILEALAQAGGMLAFHSLNINQENTKNTVFYFATIDNVKFRKPVVPGDQLHLHVEVTNQKRNIWKFHADAKVDGEIVASADLMCARRDLNAEN